MVLTKFAQVKALFLDVDGVLTDGTVLVTESGDQQRRFSIKDGYAIQYAVKQDLKIVVISGGKSQGVFSRMKGLGVSDIHLGVSDKLTLMKELLAKIGVKAEEAAFIGDDIPDLDCMKAVGLALCPSDAVEEIRAVSDYISPKNGGAGCVRDVIEKIMKLQRKWLNDTGVKSV